MSIQIFVMLLTAFSVMSSLLTQAVKKFSNDSLPDNITVLIISMIVGIVGTLFYYANVKIPIDGMTIAYAFCMGLANWVGATCGYAKVKEAIEQLGRLGG